MSIFRTALHTLLASLLLIGVMDARPEESTERPVDGETKRQFTFSWSFAPDSEMAPRGGTTEGAALTLVESPGDAWLALRESGLAPKERDRRAIIAMAGPWRASFDFIETAGFVPGYQPTRPYRSWGTEYVFVVEDRADFISLQHVLVMFMNGEDGETLGPFVVKHWRQDWAYEAIDFHEFMGRGRWARTTLTAEEVAGGWVQTVWQVDDSPRYASFGRWTHEADVSMWEGTRTLRPLPRREFSVRDDYDALRAVNRHIITPTGWVHEESNDKLVLDNPPHILAREAGLNRYERITDHDFSAGDQYWSKTGAFWRVVRDAWADVWSEHDTFTFESRADDGVLFMKLFAFADALDPTTPFDAASARAFVDQTLSAHIDHGAAGVASRD